MSSTTLFVATVSPIRDVKGDTTLQIISTPQFCMSPVVSSAANVVSEPEPKFSKLCLRLFENSTMSPPAIMTELKDVFKVVYSSDWTTDSDSKSDWSGSADFSESELKLEPESEFRWSATP